MDSDSFRGIVVEVVSDGVSLEHYDDPDPGEIVGQRRRSHYIEARTGKTFEVHVTLTNEFELYDLGPDDCVRIGFSYDGQEKYTCDDLTCRELRKAWDRNESVKTKYKRTFREYCQETEQWMRGDLVFGALSTTEASSTTYTPAQMKQLGSLTVKVKRLRRTLLDVPRYEAPYSSAPSITEVSEKLIKGKAIAHVVKAANLRPAKARTPKTHSTHQLRGPEGEEVQYDIYYRSRQALQSLGCIPRTPSPEPAAPDLREENRLLRVNSDPRPRQDKPGLNSSQERLAKLERSGTPNVKAERSARDGKREREEAKYERDRKRPRGSGVEMVDLTGD